MAYQEVINNQYEQKPSLTGDSSEDRIEALRKILSSEQHRQVSHEEAAEVGQSLIDFYRVLGGAS